MSPTIFDRKLDESTRRLAELQPDAIALFSAACAERLSPFYEFFSRSESWGNYSVLRALLDNLWEFFLGHRDRAEELCRGLASIESLMPHGDDFTGISSIGAQDFGICLDLGVRWSQRQPPMGPHAAQYALEVLRAVVTLRQTGHSWLGDSPERYTVDERVLSDPLIATEIMAQEADFERLKGDLEISPDVVTKMRQAAITARYDVPNILKP